MSTPRYHVEAVAELAGLRAQLPSAAWNVLVQEVARLSAATGEVNMAVVSQAVENLFPSEIICDFCNDPNVVKSYDCHPHVMHTHELPDMDIVSHTSDAWAACQACAALIDVGDLSGLVERGVETYYAIHPELRGVQPLEEVVALFKKTYHTFFELRK